MSGMYPPSNIYGENGYLVDSKGNHQVEIPATNPGPSFKISDNVLPDENRFPPHTKKVIQPKQLTLVEVLNSGFVRLVDSMGNDLSIVRNARVSYAAEWRTGEDEGKDQRLIRRLWNDKHTSPFEAVEFVFEVQCPIFVTRQWHRHRRWQYWSLNEVSARYSILPEMFYVPKLEQIGYQSPENKQGRTDRQHEMADIVQRDMETFCEAAFALYNTFNRIDVTRELARGVLPIFTYTHFFAKIDLLNLIDFLTLRQDPHAQWEIRQYANAIEQLVKEVIPVTWDIIWGEHNVRNPQP